MSIQSKSAKPDLIEITFSEAMKDKKSALLFTVEGKIYRATPKDKKAFSLPELQACVAGRVELITLSSGVQVLLNEVGKLEGLDLNVHIFNIMKSPAVGDALLIFPKSNYYIT